jgi:hypothetical protein
MGQSEKQKLTPPLRLVDENHRTFPYAVVSSDAANSEEQQGTLEVRQQKRR